MREETTIMWTTQTKPVMDTLSRDGISYVKKQYVADKYGDTAWIFQEAYRFFMDKAKGIVEKPKEAQSPVWMFADKQWAVPTQDTYLLKLRVPRWEILLFDLRFWSKVLNLSYLGTKEEEIKFEQKLTKMGAGHSMNVFQKPYYPQLKSEIIKSWDRLFDRGNEELIYVQGATWCIKKDWIIE